MYNIERLIPWIIVVALGVVCVVLINQNRLNQSAIQDIQDQKDTQRKESRMRIDSLKQVLIDNEVAFNKKILIFEKSKDSLLGLYEKSNRELKEIKRDITRYLDATDVVRFSKFKQLITEVD